ncbi:MAG: phosphate ABC transporter substrate-binding protein PstS [Gammaproteobacteria bacterium]
MKTFRKTLSVVSIALISGLLISCSDPDTTAPATDQPTSGLVIKGAGATFPAPLYRAWIERYAQEKPAATFTYESVGSGAGVKRFIAEDVDFGASDAAMSDAEIAKVPRGVQLVPTAAGMVVLAYNLPSIDTTLKLPREVYVDIFRGEIKRWNDPRLVAANPGVTLPNLPIQTVVRRDGSGTTYAFTNHLSAISPRWRDAGPGAGKLLDWPGNAMTGNGNAGVAQKVKISRGAIGYMEYGFAKRLGLPMAALENASGQFIAPSAASGRDAIGAAKLPENLRLFMPDPEGPDSYPIVSLTWIMVYGSYADAQIKEELAHALQWGLTDGQTIAEEMGYIPLPANMVEKALAAVAGLK